MSIYCIGERVLVDILKISLVRVLRTGAHRRRLVFAVTQLRFRCLD